MPVFLQLFHKWKGKWHLSNPFHEDSTELMAKLDRDTTEKENYRPVSSMNIYAKTQ